MKQVIIVRTDLNMRKGKVAAQVAHASTMILYNHFGSDKITKWLEDNYKKIVVGCRDEQELFKIKDLCNQNNIPNFLVQDLGLTEFSNKTYTCIGVGPDQDKIIDSICKDYKLI
jgi:PTH2 family peptidyl-tRNA hydrolase